MTTIILDIETNTKWDTIWCCVTMNKDTGEVLTWLEKDKEELNDYLNSCDIIIGHNIIGFDCHLLNKLWGTKIVLRQCKDTLVLSRLCGAGREGGHSLANWGKILNFPKGDFKDYDGGLCQEMIDYCIQDVKVTAKVYDSLVQELEAFTIHEQAVEIEHRVQAIISEQERTGFKLDIPYSMTLLADIRTEMANIEASLQDTFPPIVTKRVSERTGRPLKDDVEVFNVGSRQQIAKRLMERGWKPEKHTEKGHTIVDETTLENMDIPEAKTIARYLMLQKRAAQLDSWLEYCQSDGRVHGRVITFGAVTGRATHHSPNMAQVPATRAPYGREFRNCWTVGSGNVLVGVDLSGIELRCFAHYLNDVDYINEVVNGDVHTRNQEAFGVASRDIAKTVLYATLYGASPSKIGSIVGGSAKEGQQILSNFFKAVPSFASLRSKVEAAAGKGSIRGLGGYRLQIRSAHSALNTLLQSAGAIISKVWLIQIKKNLTAAKIPCKIVAWVHDEVQIETSANFGEQVGKIVVHSAAEAGKILNFRCPVGAEYKVGQTWAEVH